MEFNQYEVLLSLAETKNISKTANILGYSQPGVSHIIKNMEKELGFSVICREKYGVTLTKSAELLIPTIREAMMVNEKLQETIYAINGLEYGHITIGAYSSVAIHLLPKILPQFRKAHPGVEIDIKEGGADRILEWMDDNLVDFAFISKPYAKTIDFLSYAKDPLVAVLPEDYILKDKSKFDIKEFMGQPFIISADGNDFDIHNALEASGIKMNFYYSALDDQTILSMVENKLGLSILTQLICVRCNYKVKLVPIEPMYYRNMGIAIKDLKKLSPTAKTFVDYAISVLPEIWEKTILEQNDSHT